MPASLIYTCYYPEFYSQIVYCREKSVPTLMRPLFELQFEVTVMVELALE